MASKTFFFKKRFVQNWQCCSKRRQRQDTIWVWLSFSKFFSLLTSCLWSDDLQKILH